MILKNIFEKQNLQNKKLVLRVVVFEIFCKSLLMPDWNSL